MTEVLNVPISQGQPAMPSANVARSSARVDSISDFVRKRTQQEFPGGSA